MAAMTGLDLISAYSFVVCLKVWASFTSKNVSFLDYMSMFDGFVWWVPKALTRNYSTYN